MQNKTKIIDDVYRKHRIDLKKPKFDIAIVNEMISDGIDAAVKPLYEALKELAYQYQATCENTLGKIYDETKLPTLIKAKQAIASFEGGVGSDDPYNDKVERNE